MIFPVAHGFVEGPTVAKEDAAIVEALLHLFSVGVLPATEDYFYFYFPETQSPMWRAVNRTQLEHLPDLNSEMGLLKGLNRELPKEEMYGVIIRARGNASERIKRFQITLTRSVELN